MDSEQDKLTFAASWKELHAELEEVREKRDRLHAANLRVNDNLRRTIEERDKAVAEVESLRVEYLKHKEAANVSSDQAASLREQLQEMTSQRNAMERTTDAMRVSRDESRKASADLQAELERVRENCGSANRMIEALRSEHDATREELARARETAEMFEAENVALRDTIRTLRAKQIHPDLPGLLLVIQGAAEQARELI